MKDYAQDVTVDEGTDAYGTKTSVRFQGRDMVVQKSFDPTLILEQCKAERFATAGEKWGEMRKVGTIPMALYAQIAVVKEPNERKKMIRQFFAQNPAFKTFDKYGT